jgi:hypothetical protein
VKEHLNRFGSQVEAMERKVLFEVQRGILPRVRHAGARACEFEQELRGAGSGVITHGLSSPGYVRRTSGKRTDHVELWSLQ